MSFLFLNRNSFLKKKKKEKEKKEKKVWHRKDGGACRDFC
jgi:hypothetical protein